MVVRIGCHHSKYFIDRHFTLCSLREIPYFLNRAQFLQLVEHLSKYPRLQLNNQQKI
ncbi:conserved hypothetical protein [Ricinus communis]|uniref:Uncharacterized protein n=1 Tax=Ricinus communis TaxID=3988 RepID=B9SGD2_RICCO|nr:conserved hypothetical protein [Ricinus communis]